MRCWWTLVVLAGCGRIGFDTSGTSLGDGGGSGGDGGGGDGGSGTDAPFVSGLVVYYPMDDDPTAGVVHATVATFDATCTACPTPMTGRVAGGYRFDGTAEFALPSTTWVGAPPFTVMFFAQPDTIAPRMSMLVKPASATSALNAVNLVVENGTGRLLFESATNATTTDRLVANGDVRGAWHHIAASWDGTRKRVYIDGTERAAQGNGFFDSTLSLRVGADVDNGTTTAFYQGGLDELRFYDRALAESEIGTLATP